MTAPIISALQAFLEGQSLRSDLFDARTALFVQRDREHHVHPGWTGDQLNPTLQLINAFRNSDVRRIDNLYHFGIRIDDRYLTDALFAAAKYGSLEWVRYLVEEKEGRRANIHARGGRLIGAAAHSLEVLKYLVDRGLDLYGVNDLVLIEAAAYGAVDVLEWLLTPGLHPIPFDMNMDDSWPIRIAAMRGQTEVIDFLLSRGAHVNYTKLFDAAAAGGHFSTFQYVYSRKPDGYKLVSPDIYLSVAKGGSIEILNFINTIEDVEAVSSIPGLASEMMAAAAGKNHLDFVRKMAVDGQGDVSYALNSILHRRRCDPTAELLIEFGAIASKTAIGHAVRYGVPLELLRKLLDAQTADNLPVIVDHAMWACALSCNFQVFDFLFDEEKYRDHLHPTGFELGEAVIALCFEMVHRLVGHFRFSRADLVQSINTVIGLEPTEDSLPIFECLFEAEHFHPGDVYRMAENAAAAHNVRIFRYLVDSSESLDLTTAWTLAEENGFDEMVQYTARLING